MTKAELTSAVQGNTGRTDKDDVIAIALNLGLLEIYQKCPVRASRMKQVLGLSNGDKFVELSEIPGWNNMCLVLGAFIEHSEVRQPFPLKTKKKAIDFFQDRNQGGVPEFGYVEDERIYLVPWNNTTEDSTVTDYADCETASAWSGTTGSVLSNEWVQKKVGDKSMKLTIGSTFAGGGAAASGSFAAVDASDTQYLAVWIKSSVDVAGSLITITASEAAAGEDTGEAVTCTVTQALEAGVWKRVQIVPSSGSFGSLKALISWGIYIDSSIGECEILFDDIRLVKDELGENDLLLEVTADLVVKSFVATTTENPVPGGDLTLINFATQYLFRNLGSIGRANDFYQQYQIALRSLSKYQKKTHADISYDFIELLKRKNHDIVLLSKPE